MTGFLGAVVTLLAEWRGSLGEFPVVSWPQFVDVTHQRVNPLAGEEHLREVGSWTLTLYGIMHMHVTFLSLLFVLMHTKHTKNLYLCHVFKTLKIPEDSYMYIHTLLDKL